MLQPNNKYFWSGGSDLLKLAVPLMLSQVGVVGLGLIDTITFGQFGTTALAAGGLGAAVFSLLHIFAVGVLAAVGNEVAFSLGASNEKAIRLAVSSGLIIAIFLGVLVGGVVALFSPVLFVLGQPEAIVQYTSYYLMAVSFSIIPSLIFTSFRGLSVSMSQPKAVTSITIEAFVIKLLFNFMLISKNEVAEAPENLPTALVLCGLSTVLSYCYMAIRMWVYCHMKFPAYICKPLKVNSYNELYFGIKKIMSLGLPIGLTYGVEAAFFSIVTLIIGRFGEAAIAAHHITNQFVYVSFMIAVGISHAASVKVGVSGGAGDLQEARRLGKQAVFLGGCLMLIPAFIFIFFGGELAGRVVAGKAQLRSEVVDLATILLFVAGLFQLADGCQNIAMGALRGLKDAKFTFIAGIIGYWGVGVPAAWTMSVMFGIGPKGVWYGIGIGLLSVALILSHRFHTITQNINSKSNNLIGKDLR